VLLNLATREGLAFRDNQVLEESEAGTLLQQAWEYWCNDAFWLNPIAKLYDPGVTRGFVELPRPQRGLLVTYSSGGVTPGDAFLWIVAENGLPSAWKMWVSIIPIGGVSATWEDWQTLSTGARVATLHRIGPVEVRLSEIEAAETLAELPGEAEAFAALFQGP
jgi:hypothetical protein